jgi:Neurotransmitter-gated ion-channel ligand binding domain
VRCGLARRPRELATLRVQRLNENVSRAALEGEWQTALRVLSLLLFALSGPAAGDVTSLLVPPAHPVVVKARVVLQDVNAINDTDETFEFSGVVTLEWRDPRQSFDPATAGVTEKIFQGTYQFDEISPGWYPQLVLVNASGPY